MNITEAVLKMSEGFKVKLPEWTGYWFIPDHTPHMVDALGADAVMKKIKVFTKNGDILNTPWIPKYITRDDFEVTEGKMGFDFAILALKSGKRVFRTGWNGKDMYIMLFSGQEIAKAFGYGFGEAAGEFLFSSVFAIKTAQNEMVLGWKPTSPDMMATDWQIIIEGGNMQ